MVDRRRRKHCDRNRRLPGHHPYRNIGKIQQHSEMLMLVARCDGEKCATVVNKANGTLKCGRG
jgi:hypothetical protein